MPIIDCGPTAALPPLSIPDTLVWVGPTVIVDIGFDPTTIAQQFGSLPAQQQAGAASTTAAANATPPSLMQNVPALIDTGAGESCIDEDLAQQLQLPLIDQARTSGVHGPALLNRYLAYISIPTLSTIQAGVFTGAKLNAGGQPHRALIGRTFLRGSLLVYDGRTGLVKLAR